LNPEQGVSNRTRTWLRLTPSNPGVVGSAWYSTKQSIVGGFRTDFTFRITVDLDPTFPGPCKWVDHAPTSCSRRGGDGFAFVVQNHCSRALGGGGGGVGYSGIQNGIAVEFDTWFDADLRDPYENHIAVLTRGRDQIRSEHGSHLGVSLDIPDLANGERHDARIEYVPYLASESTGHSSFQAAPHLAKLVYPSASGQMQGLGSLRVYVDDMINPVLIVPVNVADFLDLDEGTAWAGFTSSTGVSFQNHDVLSWAFHEYVSGEAPRSITGG